MRTLELTIAGNLRTVTEGDIVVHLGVVGDVYALHEEVAVADAGLSVGECRTVHYHVLTEYVLIANHKACGIAFIVEVLRLGTEHSALENLVGAAQTGAVHNADMGVNHAVVADFNIALDIGERVYCHVLADFRFRINVCFFANHNIEF